MKKILFMIFCATLVIGLALPARAQDGAHYKFGVIMGKSANDQQLKPIFTDLFVVISDLLKIDIELIWYTTEEEFLEALKNNELDFAYAKEHDSFLSMVKEHNFEPVATVTAFGKKQNAVCLYTKSDRDITTIDNMEGLSILTYYTRDGYYPLRQVLGDRKPDKFFSKTIPTYSGQDSLRRLLDGEADVAFLYDSNVDLLKMGNPAIMNDLKKIICAPEQYNPGINRNKSKNIPPDLIAKMTDIISKAHKAPALKKYKGLMQSTQIKFIPITMKDYEPLFKMYSDAEKKGWDKDYAKWAASLPPAK